MRGAYQILKGVGQMKVTVYGRNDFLKTEDKVVGVDWDLISTKVIKRRNGMETFELRITRGKRDVVFNDGYYNLITVQDEETGRYFIKHEH